VIHGVISGTNPVHASVFWSSMISSKVVAAAVEPCCKRAMDCENAARRASRYAVWNSGASTTVEE
jgi:hypothetical protein